MKQQYIAMPILIVIFFFLSTLSATGESEKKLENHPSQFKDFLTVLKKYENGSREEYDQTLNKFIEKKSLEPINSIVHYINVSEAMELQIQLNLTNNRPELSLQNLQTLSRRNLNETKNKIILNEDLMHHNQIILESFIKIASFFELNGLSSSTKEIAEKGILLCNEYKKNDIYDYRNELLILNLLSNNFIDIENLKISEEEKNFESLLSKSQCLFWIGKHKEVLDIYNKNEIFTRYPLKREFIKKYYKYYENILLSAIEAKDKKTFQSLVKNYKNICKNNNLDKNDYHKHVIMFCEAISDKSDGKITKALSTFEKLEKYCLQDFIFRTNFLPYILWQQQKLYYQKKDYQSLDDTNNAFQNIYYNNHSRIILRIKSYMND